jgi:hypothetical protein
MSATGNNKDKNQHVIKRDSGWAVRGEGNLRDTSHHHTQGDAIDAARDIAKNQRSEVVIHGRDGKIRDKDSFGNDPCPTKDGGGTRNTGPRKK